MTVVEVESEQWRQAKPGEPGPFDDRTRVCPLLELVGAASAVEKVFEHAG